MPARRLILICISLATFPLAGCSDDYSLRAVKTKGGVAFVGERSWLQQSTCVEMIEVRADDGIPTTSPDPGDDETAVSTRGVYWSDAVTSDSCQNRFPIVYGAELEGRPREYFPFVAGKPLKEGVVYEVRTLSGKSDGGKGWFKIQPGGQIESYLNDPTPTQYDEDGWQVKGGQQRKTESAPHATHQGSVRCRSLKDCFKSV